ncbi:MAG: UDP-N-acetylmuramate dehydrogenase [Candidatus Omnitrophica bacterium]|nr:UDP-N-acetylmuramate dehydrogenase [Candidatus Omnitrophota bacterium]
MLIKTDLNLSQAIKNLGIKGRVINGEELRSHTTIKIGGRAEVFVDPSSILDIEKIIVFANSNQIPCFILGGGSKVLFPDETLKGIVLNFKNHFLKNIEFCEEFIKVGSGVSTKELLRWMIENSWGGWEFLAGIPCSLGGAVCLNAGVREIPDGEKHIQIGDFVKMVKVMDRFGKVMILDKEDLKFDYRTSNLRGFIILEIGLVKGEKKDASLIKKRIIAFLNYRKKTQELGLPSAGCVFKNPLDVKRSSGELIELSGMKGKRMGDVVVSKKHANFFINLGRATAKDFLLLMELIQNRVKSDHGVWLEPEINVVRNL